MIQLRCLSSVTRKIYYFSYRKNLFRLTIVSLFGLLIYNELLVYFVMPHYWPAMKCGSLQKLQSVLLVADPQILGETSEPWIARWDNDRYLKHSFAAAVRFLQPQLVIFLGDLMDEGSLASDEEYKRYFVRFKEIFQLDSFTRNESLFIPGDNDIGGEDELVTDSKVKRFRSFFYSPSFHILENIQFVQVDKMQRQVPSNVRTQDNKGVRAVISHMPLLSVPSAFAAEVLQKVRPHLVLSAHDHKAVRFAGDIETGERSLVEHMTTNQFAEQVPSWRFQLSDHLVNEVVVPTCSYRMGVRNMGFGVALIDGNGEAWCYHMLWLPDRFLALISYVVAIAAVLAASICLYSPSSCRATKSLSPSYRRL